MATDSSNFSAFDAAQAEEASERWKKLGKKRTASLKRSEIKENLDHKQYTKVETPERMVNRINRLLNRVRETLPELDPEFAEESMSDELAKYVQAEPVDEGDLTDAFVEWVLGETRDFLSVDFLEEAQVVSRAVARIVTKLPKGRRSFGTGFMVSPRLMLTNQHVFPDAKTAGMSTAEFDFQRNYHGANLTVQEFDFDPDAFFLNDKELDFALVAVKPSSKAGKALGDYGSIPLIKDLGKISVGEPINIIQHPNGEMKQVVLRENKLLDVAELHLHYAADTEPGSSGSPVFNDQWELICLHHSGVPKTNATGQILTKNGDVWKKGSDTKSIVWLANEGVRISKLFAHLENAEVSAAQKPLLAEALKAAPASVRTPESKPGPKIIPRTKRPPKEQPVSDSTPRFAGGDYTFTIPLNITLSFGTAPKQSTPKRPDDGEATGFAEGASGPSPKPLPNYEDRPGFDPKFLGVSVPMPTLSNGIKGLAATVDDDDNPFELKYFHYSVLFNKVRRIAFVSAVNYHGKPKFKQPRTGSDKWYFDPRIDKGLQAGEEFYAKNPFDRGHLTRRADSGWGDTAEEALAANDDTFHFTNCAPQHEITNQGMTERGQGIELWGKLEDHVQKQAASNGKLCVFNGPIFGKNDRRVVSKQGNKLQVPKEFFKIIAYKKSNGKLGCAAFVLTQEAFIQDITEDFTPGEFESVQRSVASLEASTGLRFGPLRDADAFESPDAEAVLAESTLDHIPLRSLSDVVL